MVFKIHVQKIINKNLVKIINATPGLVHFSSRQNVFISMLPVVKNTTAMIRNTVEMTKYKYEGVHKLFNVVKDAIFIIFLYIKILYNLS